MASPLRYLIHPDPPPPPAPDIGDAIHAASGTRTPLIAPSGLSGPSGPPVLAHGPAPALPSLPRPGPDHVATAQDHPGNHNKSLPLYQCADCLRRSLCHPMIPWPLVKPLTLPRPLLSPRASPGRATSNPAMYRHAVADHGHRDTSRRIPWGSALPVMCVTLPDPTGHSDPTNTDARSAPKASREPTSSSVTAPTTKRATATNADASARSPRRAAWPRPAPPAQRPG
jgi:hypothetical protein